MATDTNDEPPFGQCRCCLNFGYYKEFYLERYRETFLELFNLTLSTDKKLTNMICPNCIIRMNDASEFVTMVMESEKQLLEQINNTSNTEFTNPLDLGLHSELDIKPELDEELKEEPQEYRIDYVHVDDNDDDDDDNGPSLTNELVLKTDEETLFDNIIEIDIPIPCKGSSSSHSFPRIINQTTTKTKSKVCTKNVTSVIPLDSKFHDRQTKIESDKCNESNKYSLKRYSCTVCKFETKTAYLLKLHFKAHFSGRNFTCDICHHIATTKVTLINHIRTHTGEKPYACKICDKKFVERTNLNIHMRIHTGEMPFACKICYKKFTLKCNLNEHLRTHTGEKPYACEICNMKFRLNCTLKRHVKTHTGEKPFTCKICNKQFSRSTQLKGHIVTHTGEKPHARKVCDKKFVNRQDLNTHVRTHTEKKPYACEICDAKFSARKGLNRHIKIHLQV